MRRRLECIPRAAGEGGVELLSPAVGVLTRAVPEGRVLVTGEPAGVLLVLDVPHELVVPAGAAGRVASPLPERVHEPVGHGARLYLLAPLAEAAAEARAEAVRPEEGDAALVLPAPHSGRFWHRPSPKDPPFVSPGDLLETGRPVGLLEVMKTFTHVAYAATAGLPPRARVLRLVPADGDEVSEGAPLLELEPA